MLFGLFLLVILVVEGEGKVSCGGHKADDCKSCPSGHGAKWCNGDCKWCDLGGCQLKSKACTGKVSCGRHEADDCNACPSGHGAKWCNGDCKWCDHGGCQLKSKACTVIGRWNPWSRYTPCSTTCGQGAKLRMRLCVNPSCSGKDQAKCEGSDHEITQCNVKDCADIVNGQWSAWSSYSSCPCEKKNEKQERTRTCSNPRPANGGSNCVGVSSQSKACEYRKCTDACGGNAKTTYADYDATMQPCGGNVKTTFVGRGYYVKYDHAIQPRSYRRRRTTLADCCNACNNERRIRGLAWDSFFFRSSDKLCECFENSCGLDPKIVGWLHYKFA